MALLIARWFDIRLTQGGADAFVQGSSATDIVPEDGLILKVEAVDFYIFGSGLSTAAADLYLQWSLTRDTRTAVVSLDDVDCFLADGFSMALVTSGLTAVPNLRRYREMVGTYMVEPTVYAQLDSVGGAAAFTADVRIYYSEVRASEVEILRITTNS